MKNIIVSVINDLATDQRVAKTCDTLVNSGFNVLLVGRKLKTSLPLNRNYNTHRMRLLFTRGILFYAEYNFRLFFLLLFKKADVFHANDLDTLLPNFLVARIRGKKLVYDSHEYFTEVPELERRYARKVWLVIERFIFPKLKWVYTVNESIANTYRDKYNVDVGIVRNVPRKVKINKLLTRDELQLPKNKKIIILQGSGINVDRGAEEAVEAMQYVKGAILLIIGGGDVLSTLKETVQKENLEDKVHFYNKMPFESLYNYTRNSDLGLTLDKDSNMNYRLSLPNKLFDYIAAGIPVLASPLVEVRKIVENYQIGALIENHNPRHIAEKINECLGNENFLIRARENSMKAIEELNWEKESTYIKKIYGEVF